MDCVVVSRRMIGCLLDVRVMRGGLSDRVHFLVEGKLRLNVKHRQRRETTVKMALKVNELDKREKVLEYQKIEREWRAVKGQKTGDSEKEWQSFKSAVAKFAVEVLV